MGKRLFWQELAGAVLVAAAGTALHFTYDWAGGSALAAVFSAVNESTWEHMKLLFVPAFFLTAVQFCFLGREYPNFLAVRAVSTLTGLLLIPVLFYTYTGALGFDVLWADIAVFAAAVLGMFLLDCALLRRGSFSAPWQQAAGLAVLWALAFAFLWCTFRPPQPALWRDPQTLTRGLPRAGM